MPNILRADEVASHFKGYDETGDVALWLAAESAVKAICQREFVIGQYERYADSVAGKLWLPETPIVTLAATIAAAAELNPAVTLTPVALYDNVTNILMTADSRIGADDAEYCIVKPDSEGGYIDLHDIDYLNRGIGLRCSYPAGYLPGACPAVLKTAVGLAMTAIKALGMKDAATRVSFGGESYDFAADVWTDCRIVLSPFIRHAI
jgi:hypothetical protein